MVAAPVVHEREQRGYFHDYNDVFPGTRRMTEIADKLRAAFAFEGLRLTVTDFQRGAHAENARLIDIHERVIEIVKHAHQMHTGFQQDIATVPRSIVAGNLAKAFQKLDQTLTKGDDT